MVVFTTVHLIQYHFSETTILIGISFQQRPLSFHRQREFVPKTPMAASGGGRREGSLKIVADQISQSVQSTSNLLHLMLHSSPSRAQLMKLPRNLLSMTSTIKKNRVSIGADASSC